VPSAAAITPHTSSHPRMVSYPLFIALFIAT
jgi:hypothetical protein